MVVGIIVYEFDMNKMPSGDIEPEFRVIVSKLAEEIKEDGKKEWDLISLDDKFSVFFNHTTGSTYKVNKEEESQEENIFIGQLKDTPYKVISKYHEEIDETQYLIVTIFELDEDIGLYENIIHDMFHKFEDIFVERRGGNFKDIRFVNRMNEKMERAISFAFFQIDRLSNLDKIQKIASIFADPLRFKTLELLQQGPISRNILKGEIEYIKEYTNLELVLKPMLELSLVRRDWVKGHRDKDTGLMIGEGEYLFLVKDVALIRKPPTEIYKKMEKDPNIGQQYLEYEDEFYRNYDPFPNLMEESKLLAPFLLDPDIYDLLSLLKTSTYPLSKFPKITSKFVNIKDIMEILHEAGIIAYLEDEQERKWVVLVSEIKAVITFPEFLIPRILELLNKDSKVTDMYYVDKEIAQIGLDLLETTYNENIEI